ncbi:MAG: Crp/Fnr family transcriptional regulator [Terriglobales bacterium]|jgi:CRP-like cAMP-binding protein
MTLLRGTTRVNIQHEYFVEILKDLVPDLPLGALAALEDLRRPRSYRCGELVHEEGSASKGVTLLYSGAVDISIPNERGKAIKLREVAAPAILGLNETMSGHVFKSTATCMESVEAAFLPAAPFMNILRQFPIAGLQFSILVSEDLTAMYSRLADLRRVPRS